jgi:hypothetical protein
MYRDEYFDTRLEEEPSDIQRVEVPSRSHPSWLYGSIDRQGIHPYRPFLNTHLHDEVRAQFLDSVSQRIYPCTSVAPSQRLRLGVNR